MLNRIMSEKNLYANEDPMADAYADVDEEEEEYGDRTDDDNALEEYYSEQGNPVPQ